MSSFRSASRALLFAAALFLTGHADASFTYEQTDAGFECNGKPLLRYMERKADLNLNSVECSTVSRRRLSCTAVTQEMPDVEIPFTIKCKGAGWRRPFYGNPSDPREIRVKRAIIAGFLMTDIAPADVSASDLSRALEDILFWISAREIDVLSISEGPEGATQVVLAFDSQQSVVSTILRCDTFETLGGPTGGVFGTLLSKLRDIDSKYAAVGAMSRSFFGCPKCNLAACDNAFPTTTLEPSSEPSPEPFEAGDYTIMLFPSDPTCGGDFANLNTSTALVAESKKLNECVPCLACGGLTTLVEVLEPCAPGVTLYSTRHANLETCLAADAPPGPAVEESPVSFGGCRELTTRPGLFSKSLCGTPADNLCSLEGPRRTLLVGNFYQGEECDTLVPRGSFWVFADGQGCAALSPGLWSRTSIVGDVACSEATEYTRSIHTDAQCTSAPVPSLSGTFPLGGCNFPDPLSGGNFGSILRCVCE